MLAQAIKRRLSKEENQKGFTLIELLAVIVILGIIAVIAIPLIGGIINNSKEDSNVATARQVYDAARMYVIGEENGDYTAAVINLANLRAGGYLDQQLFLPSTKDPLTEIAVHFNATGELINTTNTSTDAVVLTTGTGATSATFDFSATSVLSSQRE